MRNCLSLPDVISIHAPRVGSDQAMATKAGMNGLFQSTLPVWGATGILIISHGGRRNFNPRSPCGERPRVLPSYRSSVYHFNPRSPCGERRGQIDIFPVRIRISIHAPRVGSDSPDTKNRLGSQLFQSTLPVWGATCRLGAPHCFFNISIHAPRVGSDVSIAADDIAVRHISIHAPRVGSDVSLLPHTLHSQISIHAPRVGSDSWP